MVEKQAEHELTISPLGQGSTHVDFRSQFIRHFDETFDCVRNTVGRFQTFTHDAIATLGSVNYKPSERQFHEGRLAATKAFFFEHPANITFAHSLRSGVGAGGLKVA